MPNRQSLEQKLEETFAAQSVHSRVWGGLVNPLQGKNMLCSNREGRDLRSVTPKEFHLASGTSTTKVL